MRIIIAGGGTGGHLYPGLAIAHALLRRDPLVHVLYVGARRGIERDVLPGTGLDHLLLDLHPLYRTRAWENWRTALGFVRAWRALDAAARDERPAVVVGTGGYASVAAVAWARAHGVSVALLEPDTRPGLATRGVARWAREIYLGYREAAAHLHPARGAWMEETGNPIDPPPDPRPDRASARAAWGFPDDHRRVLLIFGGSQGSRAINETVAAWLGGGAPEGVSVIWATGHAHYDQFASLDSAYVRVRPYLSPIADAYAAADLALTRAGASTVAGLCAWHLPAVLVPLPTAAADHQTGNAVALERSGAAVRVSQAELTPERLGREVTALVADPDRLARMAAAAAARGRPDAADRIAARVLGLARGGAGGEG